MNTLVKKHYFFLFSATLLTFISLYIPQPLQPHLAKIFHKTASQAGLFTTVSLIPMAAAPLFYGYFLSGIHPIKLLKFALLGLMLGNILFASLTHFYSLLLVRFLMGCFVPIIITSIISLLLLDNRRPQKILSIYITFTITGGFMGRLLASFFDTFFYWQLICYLAAACLLILVLSFPHIRNSKLSDYQRPRLKDFGIMLRQPNIAYLLVIIFSTFFCFVAVLNYLPFILNKAFPHAPSLVTGLMYSGYLVGVVSSLLSSKIIARFGIKHSFLIANLFFLIALLLLFPDHLILTFVVLFLLCAAFFFTHSLAIAEVNRNSSQPKALTNAFYTAFYYCGGVLGSWLPGVIYQNFHKEIFLLFLIIIASFALLIIMNLPKGIESE